jgi:hypothetical protein
MDQAIWYYAVGNSQQQGPVDLATLQRLIASGQIGPNDLVWRDGMADWVPASSVPELRQASTPSAVRTDPVQPVEPLPQFPQQTYAPPQYGNAPYPNAPLSYAPPQSTGGGLALTSLILGILSIPSACFACAGWLFSILAIIFAVMNKSPAHAGQAKAGLICGIVGAVLSLASSIIGVVMHLNR